ncbi:MAG: Verru_Chthon cassette protein C [Chthoniobacteraceae bacterium]
MRPFLLPPPARRRQKPSAFSLLEILLATTILLMLMVVLFQTVGMIAATWKSAGGQVSAFDNARSAFSTISETLSRATLNTYVDYVDQSGKPRSAATASTFVPDHYARNSELHFVSGPATDFLAETGSTGYTAGDAIFFQAPYGYSDISDQSTTGDLTRLSRALNNIGFQIKYELPDSRTLPTWVQTFFGSKTYRFQLVEYVQPTEKIQTYTATQSANYSLDWLTSWLGDTPAPRPRVLAEDVLLLLFRPRLSPDDESALASQIGTTYNSTLIGTVLSPNYCYDSRAWQTGYTGNVPTNLVATMRNQLPPLIDVVMVCADRRSLARLDQTTSTPPAALQVPTSLFQQCQNLEQDLTTYSQQLTAAHIRFHTFRTCVQVQGGKWVTY